MKNYHGRINMILEFEKLIKSFEENSRWDHEKDPSYDEYLEKKEAFFDMMHDFSNDYEDLWHEYNYLRSFHL